MKESGVGNASGDGRHARGRQRQQALIEAARELFIEQGYRATTLESIIGRAGGSRETIYRVFGGKRGLFGAIIAAVGERLAASVVAPESLELPPREGLTRFAGQLVAVWQSDEGRAMNRVVISEGLYAPEILEAWYGGGTKVVVVSMSRYLDRQIEVGTLVALDAPVVARQFVTLLMGEMAYPMITADAGPLDVQVGIARCVEIVLRAYGTQPLPARPKINYRTRPY